MIQILFAFLAGMLTIAAPCILPMLPILLGTSVGQQNKSRPVYIVIGFVVAFSLLGIFLSYLTGHLGINATTLRTIAIVLLGIFGLFMIWPLPFELLTQKLNGVINKANHAGQGLGNGNMSGFVLGMTLGIIWTPCAGPILGSILTLVAAQQNTGKATLLLISYAAGAGIPMLVIAFGSRYVTTKVQIIARYAKTIQQVFGVLILMLAIAMHFNYDIDIETKIASYIPSINIENGLVGADFSRPNSTGGQGQPLQKQDPAMEKVDFKNYGQAPDFKDISHWLNSDPLTMEQLKGKVVLVDFWTYSCINCIRTLPYVTKWYDTYKNQGFVVIGVHTPEFEFEKDTANVQDAIKRFNIHYPVAQDNNFGTWNVYTNKYWPAEYLIDKNGNVVYTHFGEGNYDHTENAIRELLGMNADAHAQTSNLGDIESPEMYFGTDRLEYLSADQRPSNTDQQYTLPNTLALNTFALEGIWKFDGEKSTLTGNSGKIRLRFSSAKVHMVASADHPITLRIMVDGKQQPDVTVNLSELYTLFDSADYNEHTIDIEIPESGFHAFTFTFG